MSTKKTEIKLDYFGEKEEAAVIEYLYGPINNRDKIFREVLSVAFEKMIPSLIKRYVKDILLYVDEEEIKCDTLSFLITKFDKFDPGENKKAYSYYGTICVNYLKSQLIKYDKQRSRNISYEDISSDLEEDERYMYEMEMEEKVETISFIPMISQKVKEEMENNLKLKINDKRVGKAIVVILDNWENMVTDGDKSNIWAKNKILYEIREMTFLTSKEVRNSLKKYKTVYDLLKKEIYFN